MEKIIYNNIKNNLIFNNNKEIINDFFYKYLEYEDNLNEDEAFIKTCLNFFYSNNLIKYKNLFTIEDEMLSITENLYFEYYYNYDIAKLNESVNEDEILNVIYDDLDEYILRFIYVFNNQNGINNKVILEHDKFTYFKLYYIKDDEISNIYKFENEIDFDKILNIINELK